MATPINNPNYSFIINTNPNVPSNGLLASQPLLFTYQMYPKIPWHPKEGQPCGDGCGAVSHCNTNNVCVRNKSKGTVFTDEVLLNFKKNKK